MTGPLCRAIFALRRRGANSILAEETTAYGKKILFVNTVLNTASTGRIVEFLGRAAQDAGWEAFAVYGRGSPNGSRLTPVKVGAKASLYRNALSCRIFDNDGFCATKDTRALISRIDEIRPDIVHLHNLHGYYLNISELLGHLAKRESPL